MATHRAIAALFDLPFFELINRAHTQHRQHFNPTEVEFCALASIKTGGCPEDCAYCPQSAHYQTGLARTKLADIEVVVAQARQAKKLGAKRFCMGAAWRSPPAHEFVKILAMIKAVKNLGLETCVTLGMLQTHHAEQLQAAGLDYYNHNLDTSSEFYKSIITTRTYQERLDTIAEVVKAGIKVCCGAIFGMGETREDRIHFLLELLKLPQIPTSIPINKLIPIKGTPLANAEPIDNFELARTIAVTRILFPTTMIRLSAGREDMSDAVQAWCFMAGANSIFLGDILLTKANPSIKHDIELLEKLGLQTPKYNLT